MTNEGELTLEARIPSPNSSWLEQISEEILEPDLPIIDPHHHLWDMKGVIQSRDGVTNENGFSST